MFNLGPMEMLVIVVVALVVLGPQRLPEAMRQVGKGVGDLRRWSTQLTSEVQSAFVPGPEPTSWEPPDAVPARAETAAVGPAAVQPSPAGIEREAAAR